MGRVTGSKFTGRSRPMPENKSQPGAYAPDTATGRTRRSQTSRVSKVNSK